MFEYMTVQEAAELWGIPTRRVWLIPKSTKKPLDKRKKSERGGICE